MSSTRSTNRNSKTKSSKASKFNDPCNIQYYIEEAYDFILMLSAIEKHESKEIHQAFAEASYKDVATLRYLLSIIPERIESFEDKRAMDSILSTQELVQNILIART